ncbi:MAG: extracellular solute-binding protein [Oscillospiraceae bacterium]|nr:extracellular solute-binding protein [Oscillospiraceae bacterium]
MKKRIYALLLAGVMLFALCACTGTTTQNGAAGSSVIPEGKQIPDDAVLDIVVASHPSWPYSDDFKVWQYIRESICGTLNVTGVPIGDFSTKYSLMMASQDSFPDLIGFQAPSATFSAYCNQGANVALDDYLEYLPDYTKFWDSLPESEQWMREVKKERNGKVYYAPNYGMERSTNVRAWLYRKDIFEKHNLKTPETIDDLYKVSKKLKRLYPDSYPFCIRSGLNTLNGIGSSWKPNFRYNVYYDFENGKFCYGATEDVMLEVITFFKKMVAEELIPTNFLNIPTTEWEELVTTNRGFIMPEYQVRIDYFNSLTRSNFPEFNLTAMKPPYAENGLGVPMMNKTNFDPIGYGVCNTGDETSIINSMRFINWFYTDEAAELLSWGKEGETYEIKNGERVFILSSEDATPQTLYGMRTIGSYLRVDPEVVDASSSKEQASVTDFILENTYSELDPTLYIRFTEEEQKKISDLNTSISTFVQENISKFILGQRPLSEWKSFREELLELPVDELLAVYESAYESYK